MSCEALRQAPASVLPDGRDRGLLWRLERAGRTSWLYGTVHVGRPAWAALGPRIKEALGNSDLLAVELDVGNPAVLGDFLRALPQLAEPPVDLSRRLRVAAERECGDGASLASMPPLLRVVVTSLWVARRDGFDPALGLEQLLLKEARDSQRPVISLEDAATQAQALSPERPEDFVAHLQSLVEQLEADRVRPLLRRLVQAWETADLADLAAYPSWCDCMNTPQERAWSARLNDERNAPLASRIDALHSGGQRVFAAVGVLHMTGAEALPLLLARKGFVVTPVAFDVPAAAAAAAPAAASSAAPTSPAAPAADRAATKAAG